LVRKHVKADAVGQTATISFPDFKRKVETAMHTLQRKPDKIRSFFQKASLKYTARISS
jgi:hypothetical protein